MRLRIVLISGSIKDETGGVLPGVDVVVRNIETGVTRSVVTDSNGYFAVPGLAPGKYETPLVTAGQILRTVNSSRRVQLGIKVLF